MAWVKVHEFSNRRHLVNLNLIKDIVPQSSGVTLVGVDGKILEVVEPFSFFEKVVTPYQMAEKGE